MPIKKDGTGKRSVEMEVLVPGTPEQVWQAMATGAGNTAWFTRTTVEERSGGEIRFDFGANGSSVGEVTAWEPPHRFGYVEHEWNETAPPVATEVTITGRSGGIRGRGTGRARGCPRTPGRSAGGIDEGGAVDKANSGRNRSDLAESRQPLAYR